MYYDLSWLHGQRVKRGLSFRRLGELTYIPPSTLQRCEISRQTKNYHIYTRLRKFFNVSILR